MGSWVKKHVAPARRQRLGQQPHQRGFAGAVDAFNDDEATHAILDFGFWILD
ncbi:MAG: hypothetical protein M5U25_10390 [Planctomycetota bacterium]|nr:hypothetical protein [Planctomycetota bacterium]